MELGTIIKRGGAETHMRQHSKMEGTSKAWMGVEIEYNFSTGILYNIDASTENENNTNTDGGGVTNMCPSNESSIVKLSMYSGEQDNYLRRV